MQTISGVKSNLWRKTQSGLYAPERRNFPIDGLALYLPLWHPELSGAAIVSKDLNAIACVVTGTTQGLQGRTLDGDDYISVADNAVFAFAGNAFTIELRFKPTYNQRMSLWAGATDYWMGIDYNFAVFYPYGFGIWASSNGTSWDLINSDEGGNGIGTISAALNLFHHFAFVRSGNQWTTYVNLVKDVDLTVAGSIVDRTGEAKWIGRWGNGLSYGKGTWGEYRIYNRALSLVELTHSELATKWRYS